MARTNVQPHSRTGSSLGARVVSNPTMIAPQ